MGAHERKEDTRDGLSVTVKAACTRRDTFKLGTLTVRDRGSSKAIVVLFTEQSVGGREQMRQEWYDTEMERRGQQVTRQRGRALGHTKPEPGPETTASTMDRWL